MHPHLTKVEGSLVGVLPELKTEWVFPETKIRRNAEEREQRTGRHWKEQNNQPHASVCRVGRFDMFEQGWSAEGYRCVRDVEDEWGLTENHATCAHLVVLTGMALSWATAEPVYCFNRGEITVLGQSPHSSVRLGWMTGNEIRNHQEGTTRNIRKW